MPAKDYQFVFTMEEHFPGYGNHSVYQPLIDQIKRTKMHDTFSFELPSEDKETVRSFLYNNLKELGLRVNTSHRDGRLFVRRIEPNLNGKDE